MRQIQLAVATRCFLQPVIATLRSAADLKVAGLQFDIRNELRANDLTETGRRDFLHQIKEHGLSIASAVFPLNYPLYQQDKIDVRIAAIRDAMKFAYSIGANPLCIRVGKIPGDATSVERKLLIEALGDLSRYANHIGTLLAVTPTNDSAEELRTLLDEVKTGTVGIDFDPAQFAMSGRKVTESLRLLHDLVFHVQLRDGAHGIEGGQEAAVGDGNVDWVEILALLGEMDYRGWLTSIRNQGDDRARDMSRGIKFIQRILRGG